MAFGPIMRFTAKDDLQIELAPLTRESMGEFVSLDHGGGMQRFSVTRYLGRRLAPVLEDEYEWFDKTRASKTDILWGIWVVEEGARTLIGCSGLHGLDDGHVGFIRQAVSGSLIFRPEYWGRGIASGAHKARTWYAFKHLGLHRITSAAMQANVGSSTALSRSGYMHTHIERNELFIDGELRHMDCFECLNPIELLWDQWWHADEPPASAVEARQLTFQALAWAEQNVELA